MVKPKVIIRLLFVTLFFVNSASAQQVGGLRGVVRDKDFESVLPGAEVLIADTGEKTKTDEYGNYVFREVPEGTYTIVFSSDGYTRQVRADVVVTAGAMKDLNADLSGEFTEMEEFIVQDLQLGGGTEIALLQLRMDAPALMDSISSDLMSQAGASDAADALKLVSGATVQNGKYAVVRGLPDRYVNSQLNGVRLPTADADKRAVQLDQFPSDIIESVQVSKTFTPDQQGDASGGAVNIMLKDIPEQAGVNLKLGTGYKSNVTGENDFLSYDGGGINFFGDDDRDMPSSGLRPESTVGISKEDAPMEYNWSVSGGGKFELDDGTLIGGYGNLFYDKGGSHSDDGIDDEYWIEDPGDSMTPQYSQGKPSGRDHYTSLYDVTTSTEELQWGGLGMLGIEFDEHKFGFLYNYTRTTEDKAILAEDTRGKATLNDYYPDVYDESYQDYDHTDINHPGNSKEGKDAAPYQRIQTLEYTERTVESFQLSGEHNLPDFDVDFVDWMSFDKPIFDWLVSFNSSRQYQPDKRMFAAKWLSAYEQSSRGGSIFYPDTYRQLTPAANFNMGNFQRIWKDITEESTQFSLNLKLPFEQWDGEEGYFKLGFFDDSVDRKYEQSSYSNSQGDSGLAKEYAAPWESYWSDVFPPDAAYARDIDVDYDGTQDIQAFYYMLDMPLTTQFSILGGARLESTDMAINNTPEDEVKMIFQGASGPVDYDPDKANVAFKQDDVLPSVGLTYNPWENITVKGSYSETVARQTFKELSPIMQQDYLGGDVFIGYNNLEMSSLKNYDLRFDYTPYDGGLLSFSYFYKDVTDPIEYVQMNAGFTYTTPMNYPEGRLEGYEVELRQDLGRFWDNFNGFSVGANATLIDSEVTLPKTESEALAAPNLQVDMTERDMTNTPEHLYNFFATYDIDETKTRLGLFYTIRGDTLVAGAGQSGGNFIPSVYETEYGSLNFSLSQKLGEIWTLGFKAKNLLDPEIESVYRYGGSDTTKTSYTKGMEFSISLSAAF